MENFVKHTSMNEIINNRTIVVVIISFPYQMETHFYRAWVKIPENDYVHTS